MFALIGSELNVKPKQVQAAVELLDEGNTVPFIARYRKEVTGELQDEQLRTIEERIKYLRNLETRRQEIIASITEQEKWLRKRLETNFQFAHVPNVRPTAIHTPEIPVVYARPGTPMSIQPLISDASALSAVIHGPSCRPPRM